MLSPADYLTDRDQVEYNADRSINRPVRSALRDRAQRNDLHRKHMHDAMAIPGMA
ncbi:hypothetical protein [Bradyrhizobium sp. DASA03120]|uniref:hypothetical protein n=1 Tax=Bradyrhizobium sp. SMVTL-02 TaxID=3395917 RepID=UPI003F705A98